MNLIINNAADSRKLSESNDADGNNVSKLITNAIDESCRLGQYEATVVIPAGKFEYIVRQLRNQGYDVYSNLSQKSISKIELVISW